MSIFAFVIHPESIKQIKNFWPSLKIFPDFIVDFGFKKIPPFKLSLIRGIRSIKGEKVEGYFIVCPLLPEQMLKLDKDFVLKKIISCGYIAEKLGAKILGLGGYTSIIGDKGFSIAKDLKIAVTSGNSLTAWAVTEALIKISEKKNIKLKNCSLGVIGATGSIGSLCVRKLAYYFPKIFIMARHRNKLEKLKTEILEVNNNVEVVICDDIYHAIHNSQFIITTTSVPEALIDVKDLMSNAVVCDVSVPKNIPHDQRRDDVIIIDGGLIKLPFNIDFGVNIGLPKNIVYGCMAETILLTIEDSYVNYSLGDEISLNKLENIGNIALRNGFEAWVNI